MKNIYHERLRVAKQGAERTSGSDHVDVSHAVGVAGLSKYHICPYTNRNKNQPEGL